MSRPDTSSSSAEVGLSDIQLFLTPDVPATLREIFETKGYTAGSHYKRHGIGYTVVDGNKNTILSIRQAAAGEGPLVEEYYGEVGNVIRRTDAELFEYSETPLTDEEALDLRRRVMQAVDREAQDLNLPDPRNTSDHIGIYLTGWKEYRDLTQKETSDSKVLREFERVRDFSTRKLIEITTALAMRIAAKQNPRRTLSDEQREAILNWAIDENTRHQITTVGDLIERYDQIEDLNEQYQLTAYNLGLTIDQASDISTDQVLYLRAIYEEGYVDEATGDEQDFTPAQMQERFEEIKELISDYQLGFHDLGFTIEESLAITEEMSQYWESVHDAAEAPLDPQQFVRNRYEQLKTLTQQQAPEIQINAFLMGLSLEQAQEISPLKYEFLCEIYGEENNFDPRASQTYASIAPLNHEYQFDALRIGLSPAQAQNVSSYVSTYLVDEYEEALHIEESDVDFEDITPEIRQRLLAVIRETFQQIESLTPQQRMIFELGDYLDAPLSVELVANIDEEQFAEISSRAQTLLQGSGEEATRNSLIEALNKIFCEEVPNPEISAAQTSNLSNKRGRESGGDEGSNIQNKRGGNER